MMHAGVRGSSPLARGLRDDGEQAGPLAGIIPARAGFTTPASTSPSTTADHPRSRGVYWTITRTAAWTQGSSPLARGLLPGALPQVRGRRIIPARAGFTRPSPTPTSRSEDHPRSRGVYAESGRSASVIMGSSPLARGLHRDVREAERAPRIIPARAGFTSCSRRQAAGAPDHPRSRGVYMSWAPCSTWSTGSSPLAWGLHVKHESAYPARRIIPARAGFTGTPMSRSSGPTDHPRSRGVYGSSRPTEIGPAGSSPLARGLLQRGSIPRPGARIIPARAGFTTRSSSTWSSTWDHPRSRGVYSPYCAASARPTGSSPLARGLPPVPPA